MQYQQELVKDTVWGIGETRRDMVLRTSRLLRQGTGVPKGDASLPETLPDVSWFTLGLMRR